MTMPGMKQGIVDGRVAHGKAQGYFFSLTSLSHTKKDLEYIEGFKAGWKQAERALCAANKLIAKLRVILNGIDRTEDEVDASGVEGWWSTSTGVEFGACKMAEVEGAVRDAFVSDGEA